MDMQDYEEEEIFNQIEYPEDQDLDFVYQRMQQQSPTFKQHKVEHVKVSLNDDIQNEIQKIDSFEVLEQKVKKQYIKKSDQASKTQKQDQKQKTQLQQSQKVTNSNHLKDKNQENEQQGVQYNKQSLLYKPEKRVIKNQQQTSQLNKQSSPEKIITEQKEKTMPNSKVKKNIPYVEESLELNLIEDQDDLNKSGENQGEQLVSSQKALKQKQQISQFTNIKQSQFSIQESTGSQQQSRKETNFSQTQKVKNEKEETQKREILPKKQNDKSKSQNKINLEQQVLYENDQDFSNYSYQSSLKNQQSQKDINLKSTDQRDQQITMQPSTPKLNVQKEKIQSDVAKNNNTNYQQIQNAQNPYLQNSSNFRGSYAAIDQKKRSKSKVQNQQNIIQSNEKNQLSSSQIDKQKQSKGSSQNSNKLSKRQLQSQQSQDENQSEDEQYKDKSLEQLVADLQAELIQERKKVKINFQRYLIEQKLQGNNSYQELQDKYIELQNEFNNLQIQYESDVKTWESQMQKYKQKIQSETSNSQKLQETIDNLKQIQEEELNIVQTENHKLRLEVDKNKKQNFDVEKQSYKQIEGFKQEIVKLQSQILTLQQENEKVQNKQCEKCLKFDQVLEELQTIKRVFTKQAQQMKEDLAVKEALIENYKKQVSDKSEQIDSLQADLDKIKYLN